uniref:Uncharacterized protein n=1 Tax=Helianthus annuus TaxID=4232 RepID=A0A251RYZ9_HELAN
MRMPLLKSLILDNYDEADMLKHYLANKASHVLHQKRLTTVVFMIADDEADMLKHYLANKASHVLHQKAVEKVLAGALRRDMALKGSYKYDEADMLKHYLANKASHVLHQKVKSNGN